MSQPKREIDPDLAPVARAMKRSRAILLVVIVIMAPAGPVIHLLFGSSLAVWATAIVSQVLFFLLLRSFWQNRDIRRTPLFRALAEAPSRITSIRVETMAKSRAASAHVHVKIEGAPEAVLFVPNLAAVGDVVRPLRARAPHAAFHAFTTEIE